MQQEQEIALFKQSKDSEANALKLQFENELDALRKSFKLQDIELDTAAQKEKLDREAIAKQIQRDLDVANAQKIAQILSAAQLAQAGLSGSSVGIGTGISNVGNGLDKISSGAASLLPKTQSASASQGKTINNYYNITSSKDPNQLLAEAAEQDALRNQQRSGA